MAVNLIMENRIVIQDWVKAHNGEEEQVLPKKSTIRFETPTGHFAIRLDADGKVEIHKTKGHKGNDQIQVCPKVQNNISLA